MSDASTTPTEPPPTVADMTELKSVAQARLVSAQDELDGAIKDRANTNKRVKALRAEVTLAERVLRQYEPRKKRSS